MTIAFLVQNNFVERLTAPVAVYAREEGHDLFDISLLPGRPLDLDRLGVEWDAYEHVVIYGSVGFVRKCLSTGLAQFISYEPSAFAISAWSDRFDGSVLNGNGKLVGVDDVETLLVSSPLGCLHLRPDNIDKAFNGGVFDRSKWLKVLAERDLSRWDGLRVWASPPREIIAEYRCFIVGGRVIDISEYRRGDRVSCNPVRDEVFRHAREFASCYLPCPTIVMDIAEVPEGFAVIEFNPIHCSGWYATDVSKVMSNWIAAETARRRNPAP